MHQKRVGEDYPQIEPWQDLPEQLGSGSRSSGPPPAGKVGRLVYINAQLLMQTMQWAISQFTETPRLAIPARSAVNGSGHAYSSITCWSAAEPMKKTILAVGLV